MIVQIKLAIFSIFCELTKLCIALNDDICISIFSKHMIYWALLWMDLTKSFLCRLSVYSCFRQQFSPPYCAFFWLQNLDLKYCSFGQFFGSQFLGLQLKTLGSVSYVTLFQGKDLKLKSFFFCFFRLCQDKILDLKIDSRFRQLLPFLRENFHIHRFFCAIFFQFQNRLVYSLHYHLNFDFLMPQMLAIILVTAKILANAHQYYDIE